MTAPGGRSMWDVPPAAGEAAASGGGLQTSFASGSEAAGQTADGKYIGTVKSYNEDKGWGHISCDATRALYGKDVFVMRSAVRGCKIQTGHRVQFAMEKTERGPQATEVTSMEQGAGFASHNLDGQVFTGEIKHYDEEKGWGFIKCEETHNIFGKDVFVHKREFSSPLQKGALVQFGVNLGRDGRPEAKGIMPLQSWGGDSATPSSAAAPNYGDFMPNYGDPSANGGFGGYFEGGAADPSGGCGGYGGLGGAADTSGGCGGYGCIGAADPSGGCGGYGGLGAADPSGGCGGYGGFACGGACGCAPGMQMNPMNQPGMNMNMNMNMNMQSMPCQQGGACAYGASGPCDGGYGQCGGCGGFNAGAGYQPALPGGGQFRSSPY